MKHLNLIIRYSIFIFSLLVIVRCTGSTTEQDSLTKQKSYSCTPCGENCDKAIHSLGGTCTTCQMPLVKRSTINFKTIQPSEICDYIAKNPEIVLLDVRTKQEFEGKAEPNFGKFKNAINLPVQELESKVILLNAYKDKQIIVYCSHSRRSPRASYILSQNGFKNVTNLAGGMSVRNDMNCKEYN